METKKPFMIRVAPTALDNFYGVVEADHMSPAAFAAAIISKFGDLKQGYALKALSSIPSDYFKTRPGRPSNSSPRDELPANVP